MIEVGEAEVIDAGGPLSVALGPGDAFGEIGLLLTAGKRTATVVARTPMTLLALSELDFERIQRQVPEFERCLRRLGLERTLRQARLAKSQHAVLLAQCLGSGERRLAQASVR